MRQIIWAFKGQLAKCPFGQSSEIEVENFLEPDWVRVVRVHYCPDLDVFGAMGLIKKFAPEILFASVEVQWVPAGYPMDDLPGFLTLDTGGGEFDHHGKNGRCTTDLIAEAIGVANLPELQDPLSRFREQDLHGKEVLGGAFTKTHTSVSLKSLVDGFHLGDIRAERNGGESTRVQSFWMLALAAEAVIAAAQNLSSFKSHGQWKDDLEAALIGHLWESNPELVGDQPQPQNLGQALDVLDQGMLTMTESALNFRQDGGKNAPCQFFTSREWFMKEGQWQPQAALFSICGVAYGLGCLGLEQEKRLQFLMDCIQRLLLLPCDESFARADARNLDTCRLIRLTSIRLASKSNQMVKICAVKSDASSIAYAARGVGADVVLVFRSKQTQILTKGTGWYQRRLYQLGVTLRIAECLAQGRKFTLEKVTAPSSSASVQEWYIAISDNDPEGAFLVSNGTRTNPVVPKTRLAQATILRLAQNVFFFGQVPPENVIERILEIGQEEGQNWPHDPKRPWLFADIRKVHG